VEEGGANLQVKDRWGSTPQDEARRVGAGPVVRYFASIGLAAEGTTSGAAAGSASAAAIAQAGMDGGAPARRPASAADRRGRHMQPPAARARSQRKPIQQAPRRRPPLGLPSNGAASHSVPGSSN
jgi:hypothetical protein